MEPAPDTPIPQPAPLTPLIIGALLVLMIGIETILQLADRGLVGTLRWRTLTYQYGAFWPGLLDDWAPNYRGQPAAMFLTYAFLHGGLSHLVGNMAALWVLGGQICDRAGQRGFLMVYAVTALGGALCYAALSNGIEPMVGASGSLFGLAGIWTGWQWLDRPPGWQRGLWLGSVLLGLIAVNIALFFWHDGKLAWQTHLGGYVTGFALAGWLGRTAGSDANKVGKS